MKKEYIVDSGLQSKFSELSGDFNPLHVDELYARKTFFGKQVVHGVHQLFAMLNVLASKIDFPFFITKIDANFDNALGVGEVGIINCFVNGDHANATFCLKDETQISSLNFVFRKTIKPDHSKFSPKQPFSRKPLNHENFNSEYLLEGLFYDEELLKNLFLNVYEKISSVNTAMLLAATRIVGMKYPGLNSIFNKLALHFKNENFYEFVYRSIKKHPFLNLIQIEVDSGNVSGDMRTFLRPEHKVQTPLEQLKSYKLPDCSGQRALIVGGSRGIGLQCLKLLGLNGAVTLFSYYRNYVDAKAIKEEFDKNGYSTEFIQLDVNDLSDEALERIKTFNPTHLYYFATPQISVGTGNLSRRKFVTFADSYIFSLDNLIRKTGIKAIFAPSSTAIDEFPKDMLEYAFAKQAMEAYAKWMTEKKKIRIYTPRFPRIETDQTQNILSIHAMKAEDVLKKELSLFLVNKE